MENKSILKGILLTTATTGFQNDILYFVRTNTGKTDGYLYLNGKMYGTADEVKTLLGSLPEGYDTWRQFVDAVSGQTSAISADIETLSGLTSAHTENIETLSGLTSANTQNIETLSGLTSANTQNIQALSGLTSANTEDIAALQDELDTLNAETINEVGYDAEDDKVYLIDNSGNTTTGAVLGLASKIEAVSGLTSANTQNIETLSGLTSANTQNIQTLSGLTSANTENITTLMANSATTGSVAEKIATAIAGLDGETANTKPAQNAFVEDVTETDGVITVTYGTLPQETDVTATGDTLVDATATGHSVTVSATEALTSAVTNANQAAVDIPLLSAATSGIAVDLETLSGATTAISSDVTTLKADSATTGSVDQKIATAIAGLDGETANTKPAQNAFVEDVTETDGVITVTYGTLPQESDVTATGDTLVDATATGHSVTVSATQDLVDAVAKANSAVQSVNGQSGTATTINAGHIELGSDITSGGTTILSGDTTIDDAFEDVYTKIDAASKAATITSTGNSIDVTTGATGNNLEVNLEEGTASTVEDGHIEITQNASGALYGLLYYGGDDME